MPQVPLLRSTARQIPFLRLLARLHFVRRSAKIISENLVSKLQITLTNILCAIIKLLKLFQWKLNQLNFGLYIAYLKRGTNSKLKAALLILLNLNFLEFKEFLVNLSYLETAINLFLHFMFLMFTSLRTLTSVR